jgi:hypothetical protein
MRNTEMNKMRCEVSVCTMKHIELVLRHVSIIAVRSKGVGLVASEVVVGVEQRSSGATRERARGGGEGIR